jgi:predicted O-methyltransferase YrrM
MSPQQATAVAKSKSPIVAAELNRLLLHPPKLHRDWSTSDGLTSYGIQPSFLQLLAELVVPGSVTLETGTGVSSIAFAIIGTEHIGISPSADEHARIRKYCQDFQISAEHLHFIAAPSYAYLPTLDLQGGQLDFALIDGSHAFPQPIIDYFYIDKHLKVGGLLAIDDLPISSVAMVHRFLITDSAYELTKIDCCKTSIYRKVRVTEYPKDWVSQEMNKRYPDFSFLPIRLRIRHAARRIPGLPAIYRLLKR